MTKLDLKKIDKTYYTTKKDWHRVTLPPLPYLAVEGAGAPEDAGFADGMKAIYPLAYGIKFAAKARGTDFVVPPVSAQWWADDPAAFVEGRRDEWRWRVMLRMPDFVTQADLDAARAAKAPGPRTGDVTLTTLDEGECFQMLHVGPYSGEGPALARLHDDIMPEARMTFGGLHHEIYLSDPARVAPEKLKTILRQPIVPLPD